MFETVKPDTCQNVFDIEDSIIQFEKKIKNELYQNSIIVRSSSFLITV